MLTNSGYTIKTQGDYFSDIVSRLREYFPINEDDYANLMVVMAAVVAENENRRDNEVAVLYNNVYVSTATGTSLDRAVFVAGISRNLGTKSTGRILIERNPESSFVILPPNALFVSNNVYFVTLNTSGVVISDSTYEVAVEASEIGASGNIAVGSTLQSVNAIPGILSVVTTDGTNGGSDSESDFQLRERYGTTINANKNSALINIIGQVKAVDGVTLCYAYENMDDEANVIGMPPRSIAVYVLGGSDYAIGEAIVRSKAGGISMFGSTLIEGIYIDEVPYFAKFTRPVASPVYYDVTVSVNKNTVPSNIQQIVIDAIVSFSANLRSVRKYDLDGDISQCHSSVNGVIVSYFDRVPSPTSFSELVASQGEYFYTTPDRISVQVVLE